MNSAALLSGAHLDTTALIQVDIIRMKVGTRGKMHLSHASQILGRNIRLIFTTAASSTRGVRHTANATDAAAKEATATTHGQITAGHLTVRVVVVVVVVRSMSQLLLGRGLLAATYAAADQRLNAKAEYAAPACTPERRAAGGRAVAFFFERLFSFIKYKIYFRFNSFLIVCLFVFVCY